MRQYNFFKARPSQLENQNVVGSTFVQIDLLTPASRNAGAVEYNG